MERASFVQDRSLTVAALIIVTVVALIVITVAGLVNERPSRSVSWPH